MIDLPNRRTDLMQTTLSDYAVGFAANLTLGSMTANIPGAPTNFNGTNSYTHDTKLQVTQETSTRAGGYTMNLKIRKPPKSNLLHCAKDIV